MTKELIKNGVVYRNPNKISIGLETDYDVIVQRQISQTLLLSPRFQRQRGDVYHQVSISGGWS